MLGDTVINLTYNNVIVEPKPSENCQHEPTCASMETEMVFAVDDQKNRKIIICS